MLSFNPSRLFNLVFTISYSFFTISTVFNQHISPLLNGSVRNYSCITLVNDASQIPFLSMLFSDVDDDFDLDQDDDDDDDNGDPTDFVAYSRYEYWNNQHFLTDIEKFELDYTSKQSIQWYTRDTFFYRVLNKILRSGDFQMINKCQPIIRNLHRQIALLHRKHYQRDIVQSSKIYYRGTSLSENDLNKLTIGDLITFNSFLSASLSENVAMSFADNAVFKIEVNNRTGLHAIFHRISDLSQFNDEEEVLFSIGNVFRVEQIQRCKKRSIWEIKLVLQKKLQFRSNCQTQSTVNIKQMLFKGIWYHFKFKIFCLYQFSIKPFFLDNKLKF